MKIAACHGGISVGKDGPTHQSVEDVSNMRSITNLVVIVPTDYHQTRRAVRWAAQYDGPVFLRLGREKVPNLTTEATPFEMGKALRLREGADGTIIANGMMVAPAAARSRAAREGGRPRGARAQHAHGQAARRGRDPRGRARDRASS